MSHSEASQSADALVFIGSCPPDEATQSLVTARLDSQTGRLTILSRCTAVNRPGYLALNATGDRLYALSLVPDADGKMTGAAQAFQVTPRTGLLVPLNTEATGAVGPCHLSLDCTGATVLVAHYHGGTVAALPVAEDGSLLPLASQCRHEGPLGPNTKRQDKPHPHSILAAPGDRIAISADLGLDRLLLYDLDATTATLTPHDPAWVAVSPGVGPRHMVFSADGRRLYVVNELGSSVDLFTWNAATSTLTPVESNVSTLPADWEGTSIAAEVLLSPCGRRLYATNRGHESIAVFSVSPEDGRLTRLEIVPCGGKHPRNLMITPDGRYVLVANMQSESVHVFRVVPATGMLIPTTHGLSLPWPMGMRALSL